MQILIVDEDEHVCKALEMMLVSRGMMTKSVTSPLLVAEEIQETFYPVVLLDVGLPNMSSLDLLTTIGKRCPETKIIMLTGQADKDIAIQALTLGAFDLLEKPVAMALLSHAIQRALKTQRIERKRQKILQALRRHQRSLRMQTAQLEQVNRELMETNTALSMVLQNVERIKQEERNRITMNIRSLLLPIIEKFRHDKSLHHYEPQLALLVRHLEDLQAGLAIPLHVTMALSPSELRIVGMIGSGMTNEEIAACLFIAPTTVKTHRRNIRKKLRILGTPHNLRTYLQSLDLFVPAAEPLRGS